MHHWIAPFPAVHWSKNYLQSDVIIRVESTSAKNINSATQWPVREKYEDFWRIFELTVYFTKNSTLNKDSFVNGAIFLKHTVYLSANSIYIGDILISAEFIKIQ